MLVKTRKSRDILTNQDLAEVQQPLARDGYSNDTFDQLYPDTPNPWRGTERDRKVRVNKTMMIIECPELFPCPLCGENKFEWQEVCGSCFIKKQ